MAYVTAEEVRTYMGKQSDADDTLIGLLIDAAEAKLERETHKVFKVDSDTERTFHAVKDVEGAVLFFDTWLCSITKITNGDSVEVTSAEYELLGEEGGPWFAVRLDSGSGKVWTWDSEPEKAITVEGKWGYSATVPDDIKLWMWRYVEYLYRTRKERVDSPPYWITEDLEDYKNDWFTVIR